MAADTPPNPDEQQDEQVIRPFADWLIELQKGRTHAEASEKLHDLVAAVHDTGKAGSLTITLKIAPMKKTSGDMLTVSDAVVVKLPQHDRKESIFYVGDDGNLTRNDPNQAQLDYGRVRDVSAPRQAPTSKEKRA